MYEISAHAVRHNGTIEVTVSGFLPDSCHEARISDIYPGGNIVYVKDPGFAQVFISETSKPGVPLCLPVLIPWIQTTHIPDKEHKEVQVFVNNNLVLTTPVIEKGARFIVLQLTGGIVPKGACHIAPANAPHISIYSKVFGPASYGECYDWIRENCKGTSIIPFSPAGGGSEAPRGLL